MLKLIRYYNSTYVDECALCEITENELKILENGNGYHDKIYDKIEGFIDALDYFGVEYELNDSWIEVTPKNELFEKLDFYENEDCYSVF